MSDMRKGLTDQLLHTFLVCIGARRTEACPLVGIRPQQDRHRRESALREADLGVLADESAVNGSEPLESFKGVIVERCVWHVSKALQGIGCTVAAGSVSLFRILLVSPADVDLKDIPGLVDNSIIHRLIPVRAVPWRAHCVSGLHDC